MSNPRPRPAPLAIAALAAFATYFCMYAYRKPFTAATFEGRQVLGVALKTVLVVSQLLGYMLSKVLGIRVISEMRPERRAATIVALVATAELALVGFAFAPAPIQVVLMFLNGLPLGMVFGLVLAYLEGRRHTEALSAALCASFIVSSGVVKSVGQWLLVDMGVGEAWMPMLVGLLFLPVLLASVWILKRTPPPDHLDRVHRRERAAMDASDRRRILKAYGPGLALLVLVYSALTVIRTIRDDFGVEIWRDLGIGKAPAIFAQTETVVGFAAVALNALAIGFRHNLAAIRATVALMALALAAVAGSAVFQVAGTIAPFAFMVTCGIGLYVPYVAFHTTLFERLIAASRHHCNLGFLMYLADAVGYLGYAVVIVTKAVIDPSAAVLPFFRWSLLVVAGVSIAALAAAIVYFERVLAVESESRAEPETGVALGGLAPAE